MRYAMLICGVEDEWAGLSEAETTDAMRRIGEWVTTWQAAGKIAAGGEELGLTRHARTIRPGVNGAGPVVTDGPYLELKEVIGGFLVLETDDIDEAVAIAAQWPALTGSTSVEVRPCLG